MYTEELIFATRQREDLIDITDPIQGVIDGSGFSSGLCAVYVPHATSGIIVNENADPNLVTDVLGVLRQLAPKGVFLHDRIDGNGDAHVKAALVGPSETIPFRSGRLLLGTWQSLMLCEFDGPRSRRRVLVTLLSD